MTHHSPTYEPDSDDDIVETSDATEEELADWKRLLVLTHVHQQRGRGLAAVIARELRARAKHYGKLQDALVEAIRFKSSTPIYSTFGSKADEILAEVKPLDKFNETVAHWWDKTREEEG